MENQFKITNNKGREFIARVILTGEPYGRRDCLTHDKDEPLIEFYDATYQDDDRFGPLGQFTGGRYYLRTFKKRNSECDLTLEGRVPQWRITAENVRDSIRFADEYIKKEIVLRNS